MAKIKEIRAIEIFDSRGNPTIQTTVFLDDKTFATAACPSGASVGTFEAVELRDHDANRYEGLGVHKAIENIHQLIAPKLIGIDPSKQQNVDRIMIELDGTQNKAKLGANAMLSVSMAVCKAAAKSAVMPLFLYIRQFIKTENYPLHIPTPAFNLLNGGKHAGDNIDFQEFMVIPASSTPYDRSLEIGIKVYRSLHTILKNNGFQSLVGDEGGFAPILTSNDQALSFLMQAINNASLRMGFDAFLGIDVAANSFYRDKTYHIKDKNKALSANELIDYYVELNKKYHILYLEDAIAEEDWDGWVRLAEKMGQSSMVVGDDLTVTNPYRLQMALDKRAITAMIIKPNQIGTVIETLAVVEVARKAGIRIIVSHRSGETNDDFIADFAVGVSADYVKFGAPARGERVAKYNRLLQIQTQLQELQDTKQENK